MGLLDVAKSAGLAAFNAVGDVKKDVTYIRKISGSYNATTGINDDIESKQELLHGGVTGNFTKFGENVLETDVKLTILQADLVHIPEIVDKGDIANTLYRVVNFSQDPADVTWVLQLRL